MSILRFREEGKETAFQIEVAEPGGILLTPCTNTQDYGRKYCIVGDFR
jgi:hypothetical protein